MAAASTDRRIPAGDARRHLLFTQGLCDDPVRQCTVRSVESMIERMGFVQIDSIRTIERAHHHILWTRFDAYRQRQLKHLLEKKRSLFEHWTHDASAIPTSLFHMWRSRFDRRRIDAEVRAWWRERIGPNPGKTFDLVRQHVHRHGATCSADFTKMNGRGGQGAWWGWTPEKAALEMLWRAGELAITRRVNFHKYYDLTERVFPAHLEGDPPRRRKYVDWACRSALDRLGFATSGELAKFWGAMDAREASAWCDRARKSGEIVPVTVEPANQSDAKPRQAFAHHDWRDRLPELSTAEPINDRIRLLSPFDPVIRDRKRLQHLFGFEYRFEAFVPETKRQFGYYVLPMLEGDRFIGRVDPKVHRSRGVLEIKGIWWERGIRPTRRRKAMLDEAFERLREFVGAREIDRHR